MSTSDARRTLAAVSSFAGRDWSRPGLGSLRSIRWEGKGYEVTTGELVPQVLPASELLMEPGYTPLFIRFVP
jgi:hypothetical protein